MIEKPETSDSGDAAGLPPPLVRYRMLHCNDIGEGYMNACYIRAEAEVGSDGVVESASQENWYRCVDVEAALAVWRTQAETLQEELNLCEEENDEFTLVIQNFEASSDAKMVRINELEAQVTALTAERDALQRNYDTCSANWGDCVAALNTAESKFTSLLAAIHGLHRTMRLDASSARGVAAMFGPGTDQAVTLAEAALTDRWADALAAVLPTETKHGL